MLSMEKVNSHVLFIVEFVKEESYTSTLQIKSLREFILCTG